VKGQETTIAVADGKAPEAEAAAEEGRARAVADRVAAIIAAAEEAAAAITREAEDLLAAHRAEADQYAARVRAEGEADAARARQLARALVKQATEVLRGLDQDGGASLLQPGEEAHAMALQMAMAGRTRGEVEDDLRHGLRLDDPQAVLDDVFGPGTPQDQRIPWAGQAKGRAP
jgi:hypothetical protein